MPAERQAILEEELGRARPGMGARKRALLAEHLERSLQEAEDAKLKVHTRDRGVGLALAAVVLSIGIVLSTSVSGEAATACLLGFAAGGVFGHWLISIYEADGQITWVLRVSKEALTFGAVLAAVLAAWIRTADGRGWLFILALSAIILIALVLASLNHRSVKRNAAAAVAAHPPHPMPPQPAAPVSAGD